MKEEELLYNIIFLNEDPNYINYVYFIGKSKRSIYQLKASINESQLNAIVICDGNKEKGIFAKVFQNELDRFLEIIKEFNFKQIKINSRYIKEVKYMFEVELLEHKKKGYKPMEYLYSHRSNREISNW